MKKLCVFFAVILIYQIQVLAQPGSLDQNFGTGGKVIFNYSNENANQEIGKKCFPLPDNKILVVFQAGNFSFMAARLMEDGSIDNTYGQNGYSEIVENMIGHSCAVQNDGGLVISGTVFINGIGRRLAVGKLTSNGLVDDSFSGDGILVLNDHSPQQSTIQILVQPDNKILIGDFGKLIRLNSDGTFDNTFGNNGVVITSFADYGNFTASYLSLIINNQDKIIAVGSSYDGYWGITRTFLIRYNPDGSLDNSLDGDGILQLNFNLGNEPTITNAELQADGKVLITGYVITSYNPFQRDALIARFLEDGTFDPTFNTTGYVIADLALSYDDPSNIYACADGKILICNRYKTAAARFNADGSWDLTFGDNGMVVPLINNGDMEAYDIVAVNSNEIYVIGLNYNGPKDCIVLNLLNDGTLDNTFDEDGIVHLYIEGCNSIARDIFRLSNGKIFCMGVKSPYDTLSFALFLSDGTPDPAFGNNGMIVTALSRYRRRAIMQQDEKFLVPVYFNNAYAIARFTNSGELDSTFSSGSGIVSFPSIPSYNNQEFMSMSIQSDGSILALRKVTPQTGGNGYWNNYCLAVFRFHPDGNIDSMFGTNGVQIIPAGYSYNSPRGFSDARVMTRADGKIVVAGSLMLNSPYYYSGMKLFLARFNTDGSFDTTFDGDGTLLTPQYIYDGLSSFVLNDNKILVNSSNLLLQYNENGSLDNAFGNAGIANTSPNVTGTYGNIVIQQDGKIIKKGSHNPILGTSYISRYLANGSLDVTFGNSGHVLIPSDANFGPYTEEDISIFDDILLLGGFVRSPIEKAIIHKYWLSDVQLYCNNEVTVYTDPGICSASVNNIDPVLSPANSTAIVQYTMSGATTGNGTGSVSGMLFNTGVTTVTYTLENDPHQTCSFTVTINYPFTPSMSISTSDVANNFCNGILLTANHDIPVLSYSWSDGVTTQTNFLTTADPSGTYTVNGMLEYGCITPADFIYDKEALISSYTLLATNSIKLQQYNTVVNGSVGVVNTDGSATIKKNVSIDGPGAFLKAQNISLQSPYSIPAIVYAPASVALPIMQYNTTSTSGLPNATVPNSTVVTLDGNYKNVTIGTNCNVTLTGNIFGSITIGSGSLVLFTQASIDVTAITMNAGTNSENTSLQFNGDAIIRCAGSMLINAKCVVNPDNHKVVMYLGKTNGAPVSFTVDDGGDIVVNASIFIPSGKISVGGDANNITLMTGKFIAENIETLDKNVIWNWYDCEEAPPAPLSIATSKVENTSQILKHAQEKQALQENSDIILKAWPNPSNNEFTLYVESRSNEPVDVSVFDITGREVYSAKGLANQHYQFGSRFDIGIYVVYVQQGFNYSRTTLIRQ